MALQEDVEAELLALESIFEDKLHLEENQKDLKKLTITIYPATADNLSSQYVCLKLSFILPEHYPEIHPEIIFAMSRGLSDHRLQELKDKMVTFAEERHGEYVLYDLIEMAKDILTSNNIPSCPCPICLSVFHDCDKFLKTECYHYFHLYCLHQYLIHQDDTKQKNANGAHTLPCPVCRSMVKVDVESLVNACEPLNNDSSGGIVGMARKHQLTFANHYKRQLENGCLIDLEYEKNKYLLSNIEQAYIANKKSVESERVEGVSANSSKCSSSNNGNERNSNKRRAADRRRKNYRGNGWGKFDNGPSGQRANRNTKPNFAQANHKHSEESPQSVIHKKEKGFNRDRIHQEKGYIKGKIQQRMDKIKDSDKSACTQKESSKCANEKDRKDCKHPTISKYEHKSYRKKESSSSSSSFPTADAKDTQASAKSQPSSSSSRNKSIPPPPGFENQFSVKDSCS